MRHPAKILKEQNLFARKKLGQNFLQSQASLQGCEKLFDTIDHIIEIGPGLGALTSYLLEAGFKVTACEKDEKLAGYLEDSIDDKNIKIINRDFIEWENSEIEETGAMKIAGNLPFYITSPILEKILLDLTFIEQAFLGIQSDVADRWLKKAGSSIALLIAATGTITLYRKVNRRNFYPEPTVDAAWVFWQRNHAVTDLGSFQLLLRASFWGKRKKLATSLRKNPYFEGNQKGEFWLKRLAALSEEHSELVEKRPDKLNLEEFIQIFNFLQKA